MAPPTATGDLDVLPRAEPENVAPYAGALAAFHEGGRPDRQLRLVDWRQSMMHCQLRGPHRRHEEGRAMNHKRVASRTRFAVVAAIVLMLPATTQTGARAGGAAAAALESIR
jgi:hypothetical protein